MIKLPTLFHSRVDERIYDVGDMILQLYRNKASFKASGALLCHPALSPPPPNFLFTFYRQR